MTPSRGPGRKNAMKPEENATEQEAGKRRTHIVLKPFSAGNRLLSPGDQVDASGWRNTHQLVNCRYLIPIGQALVQAAVRVTTASSSEGGGGQDQFQ